MTKTITVKGVGNVSVKPDLIVVSMKLATEDREYDKTMELAAQRISLINDSLETIGFEKNSVKTTDFNVCTNYESVKDKSGNYKSVFKGCYSFARAFAFYGGGNGRISYRKNVKRKGGIIYRFITSVVCIGIMRRLR